MKVLATILLLSVFLTPLTVSAFHVEIQQVSPSRFSGFANFIRVQKLTFDRVEKAKARLLEELISWAKPLGTFVESATIHVVEKSPDGANLFFFVEIDDDRDMVIRNCTWNVRDNLSQKHLTFQLPDFPDLSDEDFSPRLVDKTLTSYSKDLQSLGFPFARAYLANTNIQDDFVDLQVEVNLHRRYRFEFNGNRHIRSQTLEHHLRNVLHPNIRPEMTIKILVDYYHENGFKDVEIRVAQTYEIPETHAIVFVFDIFEGHQYHVATPEFFFRSKRDEIQLEDVFEQFIKEKTTHQYFSEKNIQTFMSRFREHMKETGYYQAKIQVKTLVEHSDQYWVTPHFEVSLGPQAFLATVEIIQSEDSFPNEALLKVIQPFLGKPLGKAKTLEILKDMKGILISMGYLKAQYDLKVESIFEYERTYKILVTFHISYNAGPRFFFSGYEFQNTCETSRTYLDRFVSIPEDQPLNPKDVEATISSLYGTGLFRSVIAHNQDTESGSRVSRHIKFQFLCTSLGMHEVGIGLFTDTGVKGFYNLTYRNLWGSNQVLTFNSELNVRPSDTFNFVEPHISIELSWPYFNNGPFDANILSEYTKQDDFDFDFERIRFALDLKRRYASWLEVTFHLFDFSLERQFNFFDIDTQTILKDQKINTRNAQIGATGVLDFTNDSRSPTSGHKHMLSARFSAPFIGSMSGALYTRLEATHTLYLPLGEDDVIVACYVAGGWLRSFGSNGFVSRSQYFFLGGEDSLRGFDPKSLGLRPNVEVKSVHSMFFANLRAELRIKVFKILYGFLFWDSGAIWSNGKRISPFLHGYGPGLRLQTPLGSISLAIGFPFDKNRKPPNQIREFDAFKVHLSLGPF